MPTYEYICSKCDKTFDFSQSIKDDALTTCPKEKCRMAKWGKGKVKRAIGSGAGLIFKGSGFYITDYRSENYKQGAKKEAGGGETKPKADSGSSTAPAPAKESKKPKPEST
jgi:putative FmdB family regulatory protein